MATLSIRIDDGLRDELEEAAAVQGVSVSEVIRQGIETRLGRDLDLDAPGPRSLTLYNRRILALLHEVLAHLDPDEADYHRQRMEVMNYGFTVEYSNEMAIEPRELSPADCKLVMAILDMFRMIRATVKEMADDALEALDEHAKFRLTFRGFDGNDTRESHMLSYACYLLAEGRWTDLADSFSDENDGGNSHMPMLGVYRRMLEAFEPIRRRILNDLGSGRDRFNLTENELRALIAA